MVEAPRFRRSDDDQGSTAILLLVLSVLSILAAAVMTRPVDPTRPLVVGALGGFALSLLYRPTWRCLGFIPPTITLSLVASLIVLDQGYSAQFVIGGNSFCAGLIVGVMLQGMSQCTFTRIDRVLFLIGTLATIYYCLMLTMDWKEFRVQTYPILGMRTYVLFSILATILSWRRLLRPTYELWVESWLRVLYRICPTGPGVKGIPPTGPLLVIANHACWWDPLFVASALPRPITAMMTSGFYDIWHLRLFMKYVVKAIRVEEKPLRRDAPELQEAVAALERGECLVIFPEGYLRRKEEVPLRRFGRGVYEILKARPGTPVVAAWVEGAWGSWCSWKDGPPAKNKRMDIRHRIDVGLSSPITVPPEALENHWATRVFLMNEVSAARRHLDLEPLPEFTVPARGDAEESAP